MKLLVTLVVIVGVAGLLVAEAAMQPSARDRFVLYSIYAGLALMTALGGWLLTRVVERFQSITASLQLVAIASVLVAGTAVATAAGSMFLSSHDLRLVYVSLALGMGLGLALAFSVARSMTSDLRLLEKTATAIGAGDTSARTGIERGDEIGSVARAVDTMGDSLEDAKQARSKSEASRRALLASVSHDLRTPLTSLRAALEAVQDGMAPDPDRYLESMHSDLDQLSSLVDDVFLMSRIEAADLALVPTDVDLAELADDAVSALTPLALQYQVSLLLTVEAAAPVEADPIAIGRVIRNLIDNALRHSPPAGVVSVTVADGDGATLSVVDDGPGFPTDFRERAFDEFTRADPSRDRVTGGAGLGLAIARGLVEAHGGRIWIPEGDGGRVTILLPAAPVMEKAPRRREQQQPAP